MASQQTKDNPLEQQNQEYVSYQVGSNRKKYFKFQDNKVFQIDENKRIKKKKRNYQNKGCYNSLTVEKSNYKKKKQVESIPFSDNFEKLNINYNEQNILFGMRDFNYKFQNLSIKEDKQEYQNQVQNYQFQMEFEQKNNIVIEFNVD